MAIRGIVAPLDVAPEVVTDISAFATEFFLNEFPLMTRLARGQMPVGSDSFEIITHAPRPAEYTFDGTTEGSAPADDSSGVVTLADATPLMLGDVLRHGDEYMEVTAIDANGTDVTLTRGVGDSSPAILTNGDTIHLVGNSRTGAEVDQTAYRVVRTKITQYVQTFQFPVQVGGRALALRNLTLPPGSGSLLDREEEDKLRDMMRDVERSSFYGIGESATDAGSDRWKMTGLRHLAADAHVTTSPTNAAAYTPDDLFRDAFQPIIDSNRAARVLFVSPSFVRGLATWGNGKLEVQTGETQYGTRVESYLTPFFPNVEIVPSYGLLGTTAVALDDSRARMRFIRQESFQQRGRRGDAVEGDWIGDFAIDVEDPDRSVTWVEGVSGFATP